MSLSRRLRFEILRRDGNTCRYCGASAPDVEITVDHVVPVALGGSDEPSNLVAACADCNGGKSSIAPDSALVAEVSTDALRWKDAMRQAAEEREAEYISQKATLNQFRKLWESHDFGGRPLGLPAGFGNSVNNFLAAGLTFSDFDELIDVAMGMQVVRGAEAKWKYFCKCCWNRIRQAQERARELAGEAEQACREVRIEVHQDSTAWNRGDILEVLGVAAQYGVIEVNEGAISEWLTAAHEGQWVRQDGVPAVKLVRSLVEARCVDTSGTRAPLSSEAITETFNRVRAQARLRREFAQHLSANSPVSEESVILVLQIVSFGDLGGDMYFGDGSDDDFVANMTRAIQTSGLDFRASFHFIYSWLHEQMPEIVTVSSLPKFAREYLECAEQIEAGQ
ncbi:HNH endonuclease [Nocardia sp. NPDC057455]|uniref:HNH endonuclease n=1 Tax=Nocardia sp. NPDC057455 TaxID=3346138 RepID=UPI00366BB61C